VARPRDHDRRRPTALVSAITRCAATQVKPSSAERDLDLVGTLQRTLGHNLMGVYGEVLYAGEMAVGDPITSPTPRGP
jgi:uncharacterized protein YcbX